MPWSDGRRCRRGRDSVPAHGKWCCWPLVTSQKKQSLYAKASRSYIQGQIRSSHRHNCLAWEQTDSNSWLLFLALLSIIIPTHIWVVIALPQRRGARAEHRFRQVVNATRQSNWYRYNSIQVMVRGSHVMPCDKHKIRSSLLLLTTARVVLQVAEGIVLTIVCWCHKVISLPVAGVAVDSGSFVYSVWQANTLKNNTNTIMLLNISGGQKRDCI